MRALLYPLFVIVLSAAGVVDRIAVTVGSAVITESEVVLENRLAAIMNDQPLDPGPTARRAAADRLVDQQLLRNEMEIVTFPKPTVQEVDGMLQQFRREHYPASTAYQSALQKYGVSEDELKRHLEWQLRVMRFTDQRFHDPSDLAAGNESAADRDADGESSSSDVDQQLDAWLKQQRSATRIEFRQGAFGQ